MTTIKFKFLTGDVNWIDYGGKWVSKRLNNGEFDYWLVLELLNMDDACGRDNEGQAKYCASLAVVSPSEAGEELNKAAECCGYDQAQLANASDLCKVEMLHSYGVYAQTWTASGNNAHKLLREGKREAMLQATFTFGFVMDRAMNRIGTTGWEALRGDITAGLTRAIESGSPEGQVLGKIYGVS